MKYIRIDSCEDCIHNEVCLEKCGRISEKVERFCTNFKDKSEWAHPPCKVGDKYYTIDKYCIENGYYDEYKISSSYSDCEYCVEQCDKQYRITERKFYNVINILQNESAIGKTVFLTREEAEKSLKDMKKEDEERMKEWFYRLRFSLAYWICPEYVDDMEERLSGLLCHTTGGLLSKTNYTLDGMIRAVDDYQIRCCDECEYYLAVHPTEKGGEW